MTRRHLLVASALTALAALASAAAFPAPRAALQPPDAATPPPPASAVRLVIDYKDGVQKAFTAIEHRADMTVLDATLEASRHPRGIKVEHTGKGEMAFISQIDDLKNQGSGKSARNWQFSINGKPGTRGCGVTKLSAGDTVTWEYGGMKGAE